MLFLARNGGGAGPAIPAGAVPTGAVPTGASLPVAHAVAIALQPLSAGEPTLAGPAEQLHKLKGLLDAGAVSHGEYEQKKAELLARM